MGYHYVCIDLVKKQNITVTLRNTKSFPFIEDFGQPKKCFTLETLCTSHLLLISLHSFSSYTSFKSFNILLICLLLWNQQLGTTTDNVLESAYHFFLLIHYLPLPFPIFAFSSACFCHLQICLTKWRQNYKRMMIYYNGP